jgi:hypothetical protein
VVRDSVERSTSGFPTDAHFQLDNCDQELRGRSHRPNRNAGSDLRIGNDIAMGLWSLSVGSNAVRSHIRLRSHRFQSGLLPNRQAPEMPLWTVDETPDGPTDSYDAASSKAYSRSTDPEPQFSVSDAAGELGARADPELSVYARQVSLHRGHGDE